MVTEGTTVNLQISLGPDPDTEVQPDPEPTEVTRDIPIPLPDDAEGLLNLRVTQDGREIFSETVNANMQSSVPVTVTGMGTVTLDYYINGVHGGSMVVTLEEVVLP